jgi:hypothetical protein
VKRLWLLVVLAACGNDHAAQTGGPDAAVDPDPLDFTDTPAPGSLDDLQARVIVKRCSGQPGLCHNGQFEPNLSTASMTYAYVVNRPAIEKWGSLRVKPGDAANSFFIDKLRNRGVATQMPLGADPLPEQDIQAIEAWINAGGLRAPGAAPAPVLNNPPKRPEIAVYDTSGTRLDASGAGVVHTTAGTTLVLRHSVQDFETPDANIPFAAVVLSIADGRNVVLAPGSNNPALGPTSYDAAAPMGITDLLDYKRSWTVPTTLTLIDNSGAQTTAPASGQTIKVLAVYVDQPTMGIATFDVSGFSVVIQ